MREDRTKVTELTRTLGEIVTIAADRWSKTEEQRAQEISAWVRYARPIAEKIGIVLLRPYISVKKHLSQEFLALIALYHNTRPLKQRGNRTPLELAGVDLGDKDFVRLIEHEMRYGQAAAAQEA